MHFANVVGRLGALLRRVVVQCLFHLMVGPFDRFMGLMARSLL